METSETPLFEKIMVELSFQTNLLKDIQTRLTSLESRVNSIERIVDGIDMHNFKQSLSKIGKPTKSKYPYV
jgi:hypothetical protein